MEIDKGNIERKRFSFESISDTAHGKLQVGMQENQCGVTAFNNSWLNSSTTLPVLPRRKGSGGGTTPTT
ncbi:hypothetical protein ACJ73_02183 [Blastomyces percursus]|uniref:Uncharacterized protein n=1 Tax=Blastomyces percursus TaxID=1658174 RepID=A0A1J9QE91_9EURO|nr:hypothetical protein ACJ73_02183 [Blastomyces percursus]